MNDIVCPNCHSVTPPFRHCMACNYFIGPLLDDLAKTTQGQVARPATRRAASSGWSLLTLFAQGWSAMKHLVTSPESGTEPDAQMDAHLRRACRRTPEQGICKLDTSSTNKDEIAVIAKVTDLAGFKAMKQVSSITTMIEGTSEDPATIVTARIRGDENQIERLRNQGCVASLKATRRISPFLEQTRLEVLASDDSFAADDEAKGGSGVIIGIVDFGLDFMHRNFRNSDGSTRILALWDQKTSPGDRYTSHSSPEPFGYGRLFKEDDINEALKQADPYKALGYEVSKNNLFDTSAHGTHVADVAAGNGLGSSCPGIAPQADIVFVDISTAGTPVQGVQAVGSTFGDSVQLLEAIHFIFDYAKAKGRPCVVNISLGTNGGPHDGTTLVEQAIDRLVTCEPNRAVVIAAGNSFGASLHATGRVPDGGSIDLKWRIPSFDATSNELEIWYADEDRFTVELRDPDGKRVARVKPCEVWEKSRDSKGLVTIVNRVHDSNNGDNTINVFFERGVRDGVWTLRLFGDSARDGHFHAWIERDQGGQSRFIKSKDTSYAVSDECTLSSIACGHETIVVGSYDAHESDLPLSEFSSSGPTRDKREQPTLSAPGEQVLAAQSRTLVLRHRQSGTSISAAVVTGAVALMLSEARERGLTLTASQIREILIRTARKDPPSGDGWDPGYGYGRVSAKAAFEYARYDLESDPRQASAASSGGQ
jgi:subtilisin family serine protease